MDDDLSRVSLPVAQTGCCTVCCVAVLGTAASKDGRLTGAGKTLRRTLALIKPNC